MSNNTKETYLSDTLIIISEDLEKIKEELKKISETMSEVENKMSMHDWENENENGFGLDIFAY